MKYFRQVRSDNRKLPIRNNGSETNNYGKYANLHCRRGILLNNIQILRRKEGHY